VFSTAGCAEPGETGDTKTSPRQLRVCPVRVSIWLRPGKNVRRRVWWRSEWCQEHSESVLPTLTLVLAPCTPCHCMKLAQPPSLGSRFVPVPSYTAAACNTQKPPGLYLHLFRSGVACTVVPALSSSITAHRWRERDSVTLLVSAAPFLFSISTFLCGCYVISEYLAMLLL